MKIVCIGDSLTEGYGISEGSCWPSLLNKTSGYEIINGGISGDTTSGMLARFHEMAVKPGPDYVIIMGGANDIWYNIPDNQIIGNIMAMTRHARHHQIQSIIGVPTPFHLPQTNTKDRLFMDLEKMQQRLEKYIQTLKQFIQTDEQPFIDFSDNMHPGLFLADGLHPNEEGHKVMAENAKLALDKILPVR